jgi:hypothetical protein
MKPIALSEVHGDAVDLHHGAGGDHALEVGGDARHINADAASVDLEHEGAPEAHLPLAQRPRGDATSVVPFVNSPACHHARPA